MEGIIKMLEINTGALSIFALCSVLMSYRKDCDKMKNVTIAHLLAKIIFILDCAIMFLKIEFFGTINKMDILLVILWGLAIALGYWAKYNIRRKNELL